MQKKAICPCMPGQESRWGFVSSSAKQSLVFINENQWFFFLIFLAARNFHKPVPVVWLGLVTSEYTSTVVWFFDFQILTRSEQFIHSPLFSIGIESMEQFARTDIQSYCFTIGWWWRERCVDFVIFTEERYISDVFMMLCEFVITLIQWIAYS